MVYLVFWVGILYLGDGVFGILGVGVGYDFFALLQGQRHCCGDAGALLGGRHSLGFHTD